MRCEVRLIWISPLWVSKRKPPRLRSGIASGGSTRPPAYTPLPGPDWDLDTFLGGFSHLPEANTYIRHTLPYTRGPTRQPWSKHGTTTEQTSTELTKAHHNMLPRLDQIGCAADPPCGPSEVADRSPIGCPDVLRMDRLINIH